MREEYPLHVYYNNQLAGVLDVYSSNYFTYLDISKPISLSICPKEQGVFLYKRNIQCFLMNYLPEGKRRHVIHRLCSIPSPQGMVGELDGDWPGALRFVEREEELDRKSEYIDVTNTLFSLDMFSAPCLNLSGAFEKISLVYTNSVFYISKNKNLSTHIFKPEPEEYKGHARNEFLCLDIAEKLSFSVPKHYLIQKNGQEELLVERFDRKCVDGIIYPIHAEDFCQIAGLADTRKYQTTSPFSPYFFDGITLFSTILLEHGLDCREELARRCVLSYFLANTDAHAKNYSILYSESGLSLSPVYDIVSILAQGSFEPYLAMDIGGELNINKINRNTFFEFEEKMEIGNIVSYCDEFVKIFPDILHETIQEHKIIYGEHCIYDAIRNVCQSIIERYK